LESFFQDLRFGWRMLLRSPVFTLAAVSTLALGIGANTAIFSVIDGVVLRPLSYAEPEKLVMAWIASPTKGNDTVSPNDYLDWRESTGPFFQHLAAFCYQSLNLVGGDVPERLTAASVTGDLFTTLGVRPILGRTWEGLGEDRVAVLGYSLWESRFGKDPTVVGRRISLNDESYQVLGVMPKGFQFPDRADLWVRAPREIPVLNPTTQPDKPDNLKSSYLRVLGKLKPGVSLQQAQSALDSVAARRARDFPTTNAQLGVKLVGLHEQVVGDVRAPLMILLGAVGFVLVIACVNVANLLLARAGVRSREVGIRIAIGAGRGRLVRQLLSESLLMAGISGVLGFLLGSWALGVLVRLSPPNTPRIHEVGLDGRIMLFTFGVTLLTGVLFGLLPALQTSRPELGRALIGDSRTTVSRSGMTGRNLLMAAEIAFSLILLVGAGLVIKSFLRLHDVRAGFDSTNVLSFKVSLPRTKYKEKPARAELFRQALERMQEIPGTRSAAAVLSLPLSGDDINISFAIQGRPPEPSHEKLRDGFQVVSANYFSTMRIPLLRGRDFTSGDIAGAPEVAIISEGMAKRYWPDRDPIGQRITYDDPKDPTAKWVTIVGVVSDVHHGGLAEEGRAELYRPFAQDAWSFLYFVVRTDGQDPMSLVSAVRSRITAIDPEQPISDISTLDQLLESSVARPRLTTRLLGAFAVLALLLAGIGIYGLIAYTVSRRTHEIGIRIALGAQRRNVLGQVLVQGVGIALAGIVLGLLGAFACTRVLATLLFKVSTTDPAIFVGMPLLLLSVAVLATLFPAYRASKISPLIAFRTE
jgi:putative ABC transport system permease protein